MLAFGDALSGSQKRLAWRLLLGREPLPGWRPCGAAVADVVMAGERCRMPGIDDASSLQAAITAARAERTGTTGTTGRMSASRELRHIRH